MSLKVITNDDLLGYNMQLPADPLFLQMISATTTTTNIMYLLKHVPAIIKSRSTVGHPGDPTQFQFFLWTVSLLLFSNN